MSAEPTPSSDTFPAECAFSIEAVAEQAGLLNEDGYAQELIGAYQDHTKTCPYCNFYREAIRKLYADDAPQENADTSV